MTTLTKQEIRWIIQLVEEERYNYEQRLNEGSEASELFQLRHDNMKSLSDNLKKALSNGSKRIAIKY